ncbi:CKLF-like MARVEL transmembrane domain-containing protein 8 isoform X1 [Cavia porcellus]|uniref:CKLF-like MARVEL transmembrane domain-containing protein 8 isoform X1 n=1 Tax=Cavia porcellus TaxID=10141 RepID=UPI000661BF01|nr:CKLF-like MARVEL transmembrane domain-containing protein 8 isoform X1 [Cavia porcellus]
MEEQQRTRSHTVNTTTSSFAENFSTTSSSFAYDREFLRTLPGLLIVAEIVLGLLVWTLIAGTEYFRVPAFGWVMFVAVFYWVLTVFFLIIYITMTYTRIPQVPWTTVGSKRRAAAPYSLQKEQPATSSGILCYPRSSVFASAQTFPGTVVCARGALRPFSLSSRKLRAYSSSSHASEPRACASTAVPSSYTSQLLLWMLLLSPRKGTVTTSTAGLPPRSLPSWSPSATLETHISVL